MDRHVPRLALFLLVAGAAAFDVCTRAPAHAAAVSRLSVVMGQGIRTGDMVDIISGDDKGESGKVISIEKKGSKSTVTVEGINMRTKHVKPAKEGETGRIFKKEFAVHISNARLSDDQPTAE